MTGDVILDLELSALESEGEGEVISTPRVITANQAEAFIQQGVEIPYENSTSSGATTPAPRARSAARASGCSPSSSPNSPPFLIFPARKPIPARTCLLKRGGSEWKRGKAPPGPHPAADGVIGSMQD